MLVLYDQKSVKLDKDQHEEYNKQLGGLILQYDQHILLAYMADI